MNFGGFTYNVQHENISGSMMMMILNQITSSEVNLIVGKIEGENALCGCYLDTG